MSYNANLHSVVKDPTDTYIDVHMAPAEYEDNIDEYSEVENDEICQKAAAANYYDRISTQLCILDTFRRHIQPGDKTHIFRDPSLQTINPRFLPLREHNYV